MHLSRFPIAFILCCVVWLMTSVAFAQSPQALTVEQDAYINENQLNTNFGNSVDIVVHNYGPKIGLARFDLAALAGETISDARLRFRLNNLKNPGSINLQLITQAWSESTVTAGNQPTHGATVLVIPVTMADVGNVVSVDVTAIVQNWTNGSQSNHGLRLQTDDDLKAEIDSLNSAGTPMELLVTIDSGPPPPPEPVTTLDVVQDSFIIGLQAGNNFGANNTLVIHNYGPKIGLAQFDVASLSGANVTSAELRMGLRSIRSAGTINLQLLEQSWSEATVTYGNQPLHIGTVQSVPVTAADAGTIVSADVTAIVQGWVNGSQPNYGIRLETEDSIKAEIDSRESSGTPMQLVVTTTAGPPNEPPELAPVGARTVTAGQLLEFTVSATDIDDTIPSLQADNLPGFATSASFVATGASGTFSWTPTAADVGNYTTVTFTAIDADNPSITTAETITITVTAAGGAPPVTLNVTQDSYVNDLQPTTNFGSNSDVLVHNYGPKSGLAQFDLSSLTGTAVSSASLRLRLNSLKNPGAINLQIIDEAWSEANTTGGNQPAYSNTAISIPLTLADAGNVVAVDVTGIVQDWYDGTRPNYGFRLQTDDNIKAEIDSMNSAGTPMFLAVTMFSGPANVAPELALIGPQSVGENGSLTINLSASDLNDDPLTFSASGLPAFAVLSNTGPGTATIQVNPGPNDFGTYDITVQVTDNSFPPLNDQETFTLTVSEVNQPPTDITLSNNQVFDGILNGSSIGTLSTDDADNGDTHSYVLDDDAGGRFTLGGLAGNELLVLDTALLNSALATSHDIAVTATDSGGLDITRNFTVAVGANNAPVISISSHLANEDVSAGGFLLSGTVTDDFGISGFNATVSDPLLGITVNNRPLAIANGSGNWSLMVFPAHISLGETVTVSLSAIDGAGQTDSININLDVVPIDRAARHAINRITFGATPPLLDVVESMGAPAFIAQQLNPAGIDDSAFDAMMAGFIPATLQELQQYVFLHAAYSRRQLREVMTLFWDNHFNTDIHAHENVQYELRENALFRVHALGNFRQLLEISAKSPAMLYYLNGASSVATDPNENYARELMELHTMSVDGGYTQADVDDVARAFTGWTVASHAFLFDPVDHDELPKMVLGQELVSGGLADGSQVLDIVATHPSTAGFICEKLIALLISDAPPISLTEQCSGTFLAASAAPDQIAQVLTLILNSPEFSDPDEYHSKIKTPFEFAVSTVRQLQAQGALDDLGHPVAHMGMPLFENHIPTGYSEIAEDWISSNIVVERMKFANQIAFNEVGGPGVNIEPLSFFPAKGYETDEGIVGYLFNLVIDDNVTDIEWQTALGTLTDNGTVPFSIGAADADEKLRRLIGTVLSYPAYNYQ